MQLVLILLLSNQLQWGCFIATPNSFPHSGGVLMAKNRKRLFLTIAVLFQIFFLYQAVFNYHVYTLDPAFRSFAEDFQSDAFSGGYTGALFIAELLFQCALFLSFVYAAVSEPELSWIKLAFGAAAAFLLYQGLMFLFRQFSSHCRLYMALTDTEFLSLYLLLPVLRPALFQKKKTAL